MANLLASIESQTSGIAPVSFADVPALSATVNVASTDSIIWLIANVPLEATSTDEAASFRFAVGGVLEGPQVRCRSDNVDETVGLSGFGYFITGLSGSQTFSLQWERHLNIAELDTSRVRSLQVIEIGPMDGAGILASVESVTADTAPATFADVASLTSGAVSVGDAANIVVLMGTVPPALDTSVDESATFRFADGGVREGAEVQTYKDNVDEGHGLNAFMWAKTGISGSHTFSLQWEEPAGADNPMRTNTALTRNLQVLELLAPLVEVTDEAENINEDTATALVLNRIRDEAENLVETIATALVLNRIRDEAENVVETTVASRVLNRIRDETANIVETLSIMVGLSRAIDEAVNIVETISQTLAITQVRDESVNVAETTAVALALARATDEVVNVLETVATSLALGRAIDEGVNILEVVARVVGFERILTGRGEIRPRFSGTGQTRHGAR